MAEITPIIQGIALILSGAILYIITGFISALIIALVARTVFDYTDPDTDTAIFVLSLTAYIFVTSLIIFISLI